MRFLIRSSRQFASVLARRAIAPPFPAFNSSLLRPIPIACFTLSVSVSNVSYASAEDDRYSGNSKRPKPPFDKPNVISTAWVEDVKNLITADVSTKAEMVTDFGLKEFKRITGYNPPALTVGIVGLNCAITTSFYLASAIERWGANDRPVLFWIRNFVLSDKLVRQGRIHVILTSIFAHVGIRHLLQNSIATMLWVNLAQSDLSNSKVAALFLTGGLLSGLASLLLSNLSPANKALQSVGGSGGVTALAVYSLLSMTEKFEKINDQGLQYLMLTVLLLMCFRETRGLIRMWKGISKDQMNYAGHVAGGVTGGVAYVTLEQEENENDPFRV